MVFVFPDSSHTAERLPPKFDFEVRLYTIRNVRHDTLFCIEWRLEIFLFRYPCDLKGPERVIADLLIEFQKHGKINCCADYDHHDGLK